MALVKLPVHVFGGLLVLEVGTTDDGAALDLSTCPFALPFRWPLDAFLGFFTRPLAWAAMVAVTCAYIACAWVGCWR